MKKSVSSCAVLLLLFAGACKSSPSVTAEPAPSAVASALPASAVSATAPATPETAKPDATAVAKEGPPKQFHLYVDGQGELDVVTGDGGALVLPREGGEVLEIRGEQPVRAHDFFAGIEKFVLHDRPMPAGSIEGFGGAYPNHVFAQIAVFSVRGTSDHTVFVLENGNWRQVLSSGNDMSRLTAVTLFGKGVVAAVQHINEATIEASHNTFSMREPKDPKLGKTRLQLLTDVDAGSKGGLVAVGIDAENKGDAIEVFSDEGKSVGFHALPNLSVTILAAISTSEIFVAGVTAVPKTEAPAASASAAPAASAREKPEAPKGKPYFAQLVGEEWSPRPLPADAEIKSLVAAPDGSLWAVADNSVFRLPHGGAWVKVPMPEGAKASSVEAPSASDVWVIERDGDKTTKLYRSHPPKRQIVVGGGQADSKATITPATTACATPFVILYGVTNAVPNFDFPLTRAALKGHVEFADATFVVTEGWQLGAFVPSIEMGEKLSAAVSASVKGQKPQVVCANPRIRYEFPFDLTTGKTKP